MSITHVLPATADLVQAVGVTPAAWAKSKQKSRAVRRASGLVDKGGVLFPIVMAASRPLGLLLACILTAAGTAFGQGPIIGSNPSNFGELIVKAIRIGYQIVFVVGVVAVAHFAIGVYKSEGNQGIPWMRLWGALACFGVSILASVVYNFARGNAVEVDLTDLGGN